MINPSKTKTMKKNSQKIGIMSGRLSAQINDKIQSFPYKTWRDEFFLAEKCGFDSIEWIFDLHPNPIATNEGINEIKNLMDETHIEINAICCDYFMENLLFNIPSFDIDNNLEMLKKLIHKCNQLEIKNLEIPLVDSSSLKTNENQEQFVLNLKKILPIAQQNQVFLTIESDLPPNNFKKLLEKFDHPNIKANYDTGNSASLGYDVKNELELLEPWISNIHIKDRLFRGTTVPLGNGDTNFELFFSMLSKINFNGDLIIQGARLDKYETPVETCKKYLEFVKQYVDKYS
jgi:hexulose-6-phosphate isomerase